MTNVVEIADEVRNRVGSLTFDSAPDRLSVQRTADGFELGLPFTVALGFKGGADPQPLLTDISATITAVNEHSSALFLGRAGQDAWFVAGNPSSSVATNLLWRAPLAALAACEKFRDVQRPRFRITVLGQLSFIVPVLGRRLRTEPLQVHGDVHITYPTDVWIKAVREIGVSQAIYLEVPLPASPPKPWDAVWRSLAEATTAFEHGGETGRKGAILAIRQALDEWRAIDGQQEDFGPGWVRPKKEERETRTARQRLDAIRWHIREYANLAAHSEATHWSRDDAVFLLSSVASLVALRSQ